MFRLLLMDEEGCSPQTTTIPMNTQARPSLDVQLREAKSKQTTASQEDLVRFPRQSHASAIEAILARHSARHRLNQLLNGKTDG